MDSLSRFRRTHRRKRQSAEGMLKSFFGVAYMGDVDGVKSRLNSLDSRLSGEVNGVRSQTSQLKSDTSSKIRAQGRKEEGELRKERYGLIASSVRKERLLPCKGM